MINYFFVTTQLEDVGDEAFWFSSHVTSYFSLHQFIMLSSLHSQFENNLRMSQKPMRSRLISCGVPEKAAALNENNLLCREPGAENSAYPKHSMKRIQNLSSKHHARSCSSRMVVLDTSRKPRRNQSGINCCFSLAIGNSIRRTRDAPCRWVIEPPE